MSTCTLFGHRQCPSELRPQLREVLVDLIEGQGVRTFYVGNQAVQLLRLPAAATPHLRSRPGQRNRQAIGPAAVGA